MNMNLSIYKHLLLHTIGEKEHVTFALDQTLKKLQVELQEITSVCTFVCIYIYIYTYIFIHVYTYKCMTLT
jgi:hypothetical protein